MRNIEELKKVLLENFDEYFISGLCNYFRNLYIYHLITKIEYHFLSIEISSHDRYKEDDFIWEEYLKEPRIEWIKNLK